MKPVRSIICEQAHYALALRYQFVVGESFNPNPDTKKGEKTDREERRKERREERREERGERGGGYSILVQRITRNAEISTWDTSSVFPSVRGAAEGARGTER